MDVLNFIRLKCDLALIFITKFIFKGKGTEQALSLMLSHPYVFETTNQPDDLFVVEQGVVTRATAWKVYMPYKNAAVCHKLIKNLKSLGFFVTKTYHILLISF